MGGTQSKKVDSKKSKTKSVNIKYDRDVVRNIFLTTGIKFFTDEERHLFCENYKDTINFINVSFYYGDECIDKLYIDFIIACHYGYKELAEYLREKYEINIFIMQTAFIHCIKTENIEICKWLFSFNNVVDYNQFYNYKRSSILYYEFNTYYDLFKWCCINGKLSSAKFLFMNGKIDFSNELMGVFLENISTNGHKDMLLWLINEVKCTDNEILIGKFRPIE